MGKHIYKINFFLIIIMILIPIEVIGEDKSHNRFEWEYDKPENQGFSRIKLDQMRRSLEKRNTAALLVIRNDKIVLEWYGKGWDEFRRDSTASLAKTIVGGMALLVALSENRLALDDFACKFIPQWKDDPLKSKITIQMLANHTSGIENSAQDDIPGKEIPGWKGQFWRREPDPFTVSRDHAPVIFPPGTRIAYSNPGYAMLAYAITASLKESPQTDIRSLLKERIMEPIGVREKEWSIGYGDNPYNVEGMKMYAIWGGGRYTARAVARIGRLMLRLGNWDGEQLIPRSWVEVMVSHPGGSVRQKKGICWTTNSDGEWSSLPRDAFAGAGHGHRVLLVVPSLNLVAVRFGKPLIDEQKIRYGIFGVINKYISGKKGNKKPMGFWNIMEQNFFKLIMEAIEE